MNLAARRKTMNAVMLSLTGVCTLLVVGFLFVILGYLAWNGARSLSLSFFTKLPVPVGEWAEAWPTPSWAAPKYCWWR